MASSPLAPQVSEVELALLVKEYLRTRSDKYKKAYMEFEKESKALLRNIGSAIINKNYNINNLRLFLRKELIN